MKLIRSLVFVFLISLSLNSFCQIKIVAVKTFGTGDTLDHAVSDALVEAIMQVNGGYINSDVKTSTQYLKTNNIKSSSKEIQNNIQKTTNGVIQSYSILKQRKKDLVFDVQVEAKIAKYEQSKQLNRPKLAVLPFQINPAINSNIQNDFLPNFYLDLEERLVQTRRFAILDKVHQKLIKKEMAGYKGEDYSQIELAKQGNKAGADFILTGIINKLEPRETKNIIDGSEIKSSRKRFKYEANIRIIDVVSGQVKFAVKSKNTKQLISKIIDYIAPLQILDISDERAVIGYGGDYLKPGDEFDVSLLGEKIVDPYNKEIIGRNEKKIGKIRISDVMAKKSFAEIVEGKKVILANQDQGLVIRSVKKIKVQESSSSENDDDW